MHTHIQWYLSNAVTLGTIKCGFPRQVAGLIGYLYNAAFGKLLMVDHFTKVFVYKNSIIKSTCNHQVLTVCMRLIMSVYVFGLVTIGLLHEDFHKPVPVHVK